MKVSGAKQVDVNDYRKKDFFGDIEPVFHMASSSGGLVGNVSRRDTRASSNTYTASSIPTTTQIKY